MVGRDASNLQMSSGSEVNKIIYKSSDNMSNPCILSHNTGVSSTEKCNWGREAHLSSGCRFKCSTCHCCKKCATLQKCDSQSKKSHGIRIYNLQVEGSENKLLMSYALFNITGMEKGLFPAKMLIECLNI